MTAKNCSQVLFPRLLWHGGYSQGLSGARVGDVVFSESRNSSHKLLHEKQFGVVLFKLGW